MSASMMTRSPSPSLTSRRSYSPQPSPAPFLTPNPFEETSRPLPKRLLSLQGPARPSPYAYPFPSPSLASNPIPTVNASTSSNTSPANRPSLGGSVTPGAQRPGLKRPGVPHRSHSFCASGNNTTFALASASASSNLSPDKKILVAPPLERTLSSIGSRGNCSPPSQQMQRPFPGGDDIEDIENRNFGPGQLSQMQRTPTRARIGLEATVLNEKDINGQQTLTPSQAHDLPSPPPVPTIMIHESTTPPRPSLSTMRNASNVSSRSSSFGDNDTIMTPTTPHDLLFGRIEENEHEDEEEGVDHDRIESLLEPHQAKAGSSGDLDHVATEVQGMLIA